MQTKYTRTLMLITVVLAVVIAFLAYILLVQGPRVRLVLFEKDPSTTSLHANSTVTVAFDRPLREEDYTKYIRFEPEIAFSAQTSDQSITLNLQENFTHNTEYELLVKPNIYDRTGRAMSGVYKYSFEVGSPRVAYIERNYGNVIENDRVATPVQDKDDHVILINLNGEKEKVFSAPEISSFAANDSYVVVAVHNEKNYDLYTVDLKGKSTRKEKLPVEGVVSNLAISSRGATALYTIRPDFNSVNKEFYDKVANRVESLNVVTGEVTTITAENGEVVRNFAKIEFSQDGQVALIKDAQQRYYAISPFNDFPPILIGSRSTSFGFSRDGSEILFRDNAAFSVYDISSAETNTYTLGSTGSVQKVVEVSDGLLYSSIKYLSTQSIGEVLKVDSWQDEAFEQVWSSEKEGLQNTLLREMTVSFDESTLALHVNPSNCTTDTIGANSQCKEAQTVIYD